MDRDVFKIDLLASVPDQELSVSLSGAVYSMRIFFATGPGLWWLELSNADKSVTLSQLVLRPGVMTGLSGRFPGYKGNGTLGMVRIMQKADYSSIDAFAGGFGLFFIDDADSNEGAA